MRNIYKYLIVFVLLSNSSFANEAVNWLKIEVDYILNVYKNNDFSKEEKFEYIENTINKNFAGSGIAKFVAGKAWATADKETKKALIKYHPIV